MKLEQPDYIQKVTVVNGDVTLPYLGLTESERIMIIDQVSIIFHGAATVRFDEKLKPAVNINVFGTKQILQIASLCQNLKVRINIAKTCYSK